MPAKDSTHLFIHKTRIHVNNRQANFLRGCAGFRRVAYNWALAHIDDAYKQRAERISPRKADIAFNAFKKDHFPWAYEYPSCVGQQSIADLKRAFDNFFRRVKQGDPDPGYPTFKKKHAKKTFRLTNVHVTDAHISGFNLKLPKKQGSVRMGSVTRHKGRLMSTTFSESGGKWYASMLYELPYKPDLATAAPKTIGIDLGVARRATMSTGEYIELPKKLDDLYQRRRHLQRLLSKKPSAAKGSKKSNRWKKLKQSIKALDRKMNLLRVEQAHQLTASLSRENSLVVIEDLKLKNMTKSAKGTVESPGKNVKQKSGLNRVLLNAGLYEIRRQLEYKTLRHNGMLLAVDPKYTSQTCSNCQHIAKENRKSQSVFECVNCGFTTNADVNASINIKNRGILQLSAQTQTAGPG